MIYNVINEKDGELKSLFTFNNAKEAENCQKWHEKKEFISYIITHTKFDTWED